jgi:DHA1 family bicyclomycin/chloramphenicol resistance-like MFS transporter
LDRIKLVARLSATSSGSMPDQQPQIPTAPSPTAEPRRRPPLIILILVAAMGPLALQILVPSMPGLVEVFGVPYHAVQLSLMLFLIGLAIAQLIYGPLSDRFGRRPVMLAGIGIYLAGTLVCLLSTGIEILLIGRVLQAVGGCAGMVLSRAIIRDLYERDRAASMIAYVTVAMVVAPMVAPIIGGYLDAWFGWHAVFVFVLVYGVIVLASCLVGLHETLKSHRALSHLSDFVAAFGHLLRSRKFLGYSLQVAFTSGTFFSFLGGAAYVVVEILDGTAVDYGLWFLFISAGYMSGNFIAGRVTPRLGSDHMISLGTTCSLAGTLILLVVLLAGGLTVASLFMVSCIVSFGNGFAMPNGFAGAVSVDPSRAGAASGLAGFMQMTISAAMMRLVGVWLDDTALPMVAMMVAGSTLAFAVHRWGMKR